MSMQDDHAKHMAIHETILKEMEPIERMRERLAFIEATARVVIASQARKWAFASVCMFVAGIVLGTLIGGML